MTYLVFNEEQETRLIKKIKVALSEETAISRFTDSEYAVFWEKNTGIRVTDAREVPSSPPVLTVQQHNQILNTNYQNEHQLIVCFTPTMETLSQLCGLVFVNSEEQKWVHTIFEHPVNYQKPDGFSCPANMFTSTTDNRNELLTWKDRFPCNYRYGYGHWKTRDCYVLWEFKLQISPADRGTGYNYLQHMCRKDAINLYRLLLCDVNSFYIMKARGGVIYDIEKWNWTQLGSRQAIIDLLSHRNNWHSLYDSAIASLPTPSTMNRFLGAGGYGRVFHVTSNGVQSAMKIALTLTAETESLIVGEYEKLTQLQDVPNVARIRLNSLVQCDVNGTPIGLRYLLGTVGRQVTKADCGQQIFCERLFLSLQAIHARGFSHGDPRIDNAIIFQDELFWVDMVGFNSTVSSSYHKVADLKILIESVFDESNHTRYSGLLNEYGRSDSVDQQNILRRLVAEFF